MEVRVLSDFAKHKCGDVIELKDDEAKAAEKAGWADSNKDAVAYAKKELAAKAKAKAKDE